MTTTTENKKKKLSIWTTEELEKIRINYGTEIIIENDTYEKVSTKKAPSDAYIVEYTHKDKICYDLTRGSKITLFDMYWDKMKDNLKSINYGNGFIKPNLWGYQSPTTKKKKRK